MSPNPARYRRPLVERLERRLQLSLTPPANAIGTAVGDLAAPGQVAETTVTVAPTNLPPGKSATLFGVFVEPEAGSPIRPRIVAVEDSAGDRLPLKEGRPYVAGKGLGTASAFVQVSRPGTLAILVAGEDRTTGSYRTFTTLVGDVNGDGTVNLADLEAFASAYDTSVGQAKYNSAADFNLDGIVNQVDAKAFEQNMPPQVPRSVPLSLIMNLAPADQVHYAASKNSGGSTMKKVVTIEGHTEPGSIVLEDSAAGYYKWDGGAVATNAQGNFSVKEANTDGVNTYNFLIIDPYGRQLIRSYPVFWIPYAAPRSKLQ
jgi:Dockerin type I domain